MARLENSTARYIGTSVENKPAARGISIGSDGVESIIPIPPGSSFLETDTGHIFRFDGNAWVYSPASGDTEALLGAILAELTMLREAVQLAIAG